MTVFGNSAMDLILNQDAVELAVAVGENESIALFRFFEYLPFAELLSSLAICMVIVFFVTSADSGAMVLNMLCSGGSDQTPVLRRVYWMAVIGAVAMVLLVAGGLSALQTAAIASAFPFSLALLAAMWGFRQALVVDHAKRQAMVAATLSPAVPGAKGMWKERLANLIHYPSEEDVAEYLGTTVLPAFERFRGELSSNGIESVVRDNRGDSGSVRLEVWHGEELDFVYEVFSVAHPMPHEALVGNESEEFADSKRYFRAEVHFVEGGQDYDIMGWSGDQILTDLVEQYEKHLHFLHVLR